MGVMKGGGTNFQIMTPGNGGWNMDKMRCEHRIEATSNQGVYAGNIRGGSPMLQTIEGEQGKTLPIREKGAGWNLVREVPLYIL